eukprot:265695_1
MSRSYSKRSHPSGESVVVLGTSAPNRFCTTSSVLSFFYKNHIIRKFEVEQCSIHQNGEIMIRFGTKFAAQLFTLKLQISEPTSRYFQVIKLCCNELHISQYIVLNLCVQRRSRDGNRFSNIIRRWRGEGIIDCDADRRQFYLYLFKDGSDLSSNDSYIKLSIDDRILERICLLNNDYSAGMRFEVSEPPKCEIHRAPTILSIDEEDGESKSGGDEEDGDDKGPICPKILLTGSCTNKSCTFRHNIYSSESASGQLGNEGQFWYKDGEALDIEDGGPLDEEELKQNQYRNVRYRQHRHHHHHHHHAKNAWKPCAYYSFKNAPSLYNLDKTSDELEQGMPWTFEITNENTLESLLKFLGQCWMFCIEFVRMKSVPERFVNAIRQMRDINMSNISSLSTDYEARYPIPSIFTQNIVSSEKEIYYHPPFEYTVSSRSAELRLKRHLHDLNYHGAHDVAFALESCLHNFPPVFIPEDLVDKCTQSDPDIFFKCIYSEIKSKHDTVSAFSNVKTIRNMDLVWQALLHCALSEEYRVDRSVVLDDVFIDKSAVAKQSILPALELFYKSLDWAGCSGRVLKQKKNGNTHADHVWIKRVSVHPLRLSFAICEEESTRMFRFEQYSPPIDFCRIEFVDQFGGRCMQKEHFGIGNVGRTRAYKILNNGLCIAGVVYQFLFFGNKQVRDAKCWMKAELVRGFDANRVRADIARLSSERNIGKKMDRFHLFMSKGTPGAIYSESEIEIIDDIYAGDGKILTDGCSLILRSELKKSFPQHVASMLVRIGGAKTQMMSASRALLNQLVLDDMKNNGGAQNRNLSPSIILTKSCVKFMTDTQKQLEIKKCCRALPCMMNREFINHCVFHRICALQPQTLDIVNSEEYDFDVARQFKLAAANKQVILSLLLSYQRKFTQQLSKMEDICSRQVEKLRQMKARYGARAIYIRPATQEEQRDLFSTLLFLSSRLKVEESFLNRLTDSCHQQSAKRLNFKDVADLTAILKRLWGGLKSKFKIQLDWPSCRMAGIADFQYKLSEFEVFLKMKIPHYFDWDCERCGEVKIKYWNDSCSSCGAAHPIYYVHRGPVGLMKNPCLHPGSYRLFDAVYYRELDEMFDGEVLVFSASAAQCRTSQVHKLSGGDLDGDDFLCVVQKDLLPLATKASLGVSCMEYDADCPLKMSGYVDIGMCVEYWLNYQINDCVGIIAELHESFSDLELAVGSPQCLELAAAHSKAVDYAKTGIAAKIPKNVGIPFPLSLVKYPHHMGKHQSISYKSTSIKGILYNSVRIPNKLWRDKEFRKQHNLKNNLNVAFCENPNVAHYRQQPPKQQELTNREKLRQRLNRGCPICGIHSFNNAHTMNRHKDDPDHKRNKQMARDRAMLQRIKDAKINAAFETNIPPPQITTYKITKKKKIIKNKEVKRHEHWAVGDAVLYKNREECTIKDILYDSYPPRVLLTKSSTRSTLITEFNKIQRFNPTTTKQPPPPIKQQHHHHPLEEQIKESKDAAVKLGFDQHRVEKEMHLFLEVVKVSGHSLNPSCFLNYLCEVSDK